MFPPQVEYVDRGDFMVDRKYTFKIEGKSKSSNQIKEANTGYKATVDLEYRNGDKIPLWMFGFLY